MDQVGQPLAAREGGGRAGLSGHTNREVAARLHISPETVKDRLEGVLRKLHVARRTNLRTLLAAWDFNEWERQP